MATADLAEYEAWSNLAKLRDMQGEDTLARIIQDAPTRREVQHGRDADATDDGQAEPDTG